MLVDVPENNLAALPWTSPEARGKCFFCGQDEGGYAKKDANGDWQASCWPCIDPKIARHSFCYLAAHI